VLYGGFTGLASTPSVLPPKFTDALHRERAQKLKVLIQLRADGRIRSKEEFVRRKLETCKQVKDLSELARLPGFDMVEHTLLDLMHTVQGIIGQHILPLLKGQRIGNHAAPKPKKVTEKEKKKAEKEKKAAAIREVNARIARASLYRCDDDPMVDVNNQEEKLPESESDTFNRRMATAAAGMASITPAEIEASRIRAAEKEKELDAAYAEYLQALEDGSSSNDSDDGDDEDYNVDQAEVIDDEQATVLFPTDHESTVNQPTVAASSVAASSRPAATVPAATVPAAARRTPTTVVVAGAADTTHSAVGVAERQKLREFADLYTISREDQERLERDSYDRIQAPGKIAPTTKKPFTCPGYMTAENWFVFTRVYGKYLFKRHFTKPEQQRALVTLCNLLDLLTLCALVNQTAQSKVEIARLVKVVAKHFENDLPSTEYAMVVHNLLFHVPDTINLWGPAVGYWCFPYERSVGSVVAVRINC
jgi:hypothetical protein